MLMVSTLVVIHVCDKFLLHHCFLLIEIFACSCPCCCCNSALYYGLQFVSFIIPSLLWKSNYCTGTWYKSNITWDVPVCMHWDHIPLIFSSLLTVQLMHWYNNRVIAKIYSTVHSDYLCTIHSLLFMNGIG